MFLVNLTLTFDLYPNFDHISTYEVLETPCDVCDSQNWNVFCGWRGLSEWNASGFVRNETNGSVQFAVKS